MPIAIAGSIATDHLMTFSGRFADSLVVDQLDKISVSFLAHKLEIRRGGVAEERHERRLGAGVGVVVVARGAEEDPARAGGQGRDPPLAGILRGARRHETQVVDLLGDLRDQ